MKTLDCRGRICRLRGQSEDQHNRDHQLVMKLPSAALPASLSAAVMLKHHRGQRRLDYSRPTLQVLCKPGSTRLRSSAKKVIRSVLLGLNCLAAANPGHQPSSGKSEKKLPYGVKKVYLYPFLGFFGHRLLFGKATRCACLRYKHIIAEAFPCCQGNFPLISIHLTPCWREKPLSRSQSFPGFGQVPSHMLGAPSFGCSNDSMFCLFYLLSFVTVSMRVYPICNRP